MVDKDWTIDALKSQNLIVLECISGSHAYGLATETSDVDIKGVFLPPKAYFYGLDHIEQVSDARNDTVYYELGRFIALLLKNNPNILELLATPADMVRLRHPLLAKLKPELFLSKLCEVTFGQFAYAQIKKAKGLNKKIVQPMDKKRQSVLAFCYVNTGGGKTQALATFLTQNAWSQSDCGLIKLAHMRDTFALFHAEGGGYKGIIASETANQLCLSSIPKGEKQVAVLYFNQQAYSRYCKQYSEYWQWVAERNPERYAATAKHGKGYDAKNMMHTFRLLDTALDIAEQGKVIVRRPNRDFLLAIKAGEFAYDELVAMADEKRRQLTHSFAQSDLPATPDRDAINRLLVELREDFYSENQVK